jgi:hypothetical protein
MKKIFILILLLPALSQAQLTRFEQSKGTESAPYFEGIQWWKDFCGRWDNTHIDTFGMTDAGYPLHITWISEAHSLAEIKNSTKPTILINNAIHPGEPDGVDASMLLFRELLKNEALQSLTKNINIVCIPYYNIGGALNRNSSSRANQEGPASYGFRGNAQNLDLNRDFVKCDSKNTLSFARLLQAIQPDIYIETHVSNGADYQYTMTYLATQPDKLGYLGKYLRSDIIPYLENSMKEKKQEMAPYVNIHGGPLKDKIHTFYDSPRYSTGLTSLHNMIGFITETHMLKPYHKRVRATYDFLLSMVEYTNASSQRLQTNLEMAKEFERKQKTFPIDWRQDTIQFENLNFKGYEYAYKKSEITGQDRLYYDRNKPITKTVKYYDKMQVKTVVESPKIYILQQGYWQVAERLAANGVTLIPLEKDSIMEVNSYIILDYKTVDKPFEKHYLHSDVTYKMEKIKFTFRKGDLLIPMNTDKNRFIIEVLEPNAPDSYFNWNFFDAILQQKEWYSNYVFEDKAASILSANTKLSNEFEQKKASDKSFATNAQAQLYWLYQQSDHYELSHNRLPIFKIE